MFRGFSAGQVRGDKIAYKILWHRDQLFELFFDTRAKTLRIPRVLPQVQPKSKMYTQLCAFLKSRASKAVPEHRRIDPRKAVLRYANRGGIVSFTMTVKGSEFEYAARKLIHLVHEIFLIFLVDHFDYEVAAFDLDPDQP